MRKFLISSIIHAIVIGATCLPASAATHHAPSAEQQAGVRCVAIAEMKASLTGAKFTKLNIGQYHVMVGVYLGAPITPSGPPPGNGALMVQSEGANMVFWTHDDKDACETQLKMTGADHQMHLTYSPLALPPELVMFLKGIAGGKDEIASPTEDSKDELKL